MPGERRDPGAAQRHQGSGHDIPRVAFTTVVLAAIVALAFFHLAAGAGPILAAGPEAAAPLESRVAQLSVAETIRVPILMYHYVDTTAVPGPAGNVLTVRSKAFEQQMDFLESQGYHTVTMEQIHAALTDGTPLPPNPVALTFDDGGLDNYTVAYPMLRSHCFVATFFVMTAFVGDPGTMTWSQLLEMRAAGMGIESASRDRHGHVMIGSDRSTTPASVHSNHPTPPPIPSRH